MTSATVHVQSTGHGPDLVLLHGWAMHSGYFDPVVELLNTHFRIHRVDLPGHGRSREVPVPYTLETLAHAIQSALSPVISDQAIWLGWSLGGSIASWIAAHASDSVAGLILVASNPCFVQRPDWPFAIADSVLSEFADNLVTDYEKTLLRFLSLQIRGADNERELLRELRKQLRESPPPQTGALNGGLEILRQTDQRELLQKLSPSLFLIGGKKDTLVPIAALQTTTEQVKNSSLSMWETAGHAPFLYDPQRFVDEVRFFAEHIHV